MTQAAGIQERDLCIVLFQYGESLPAGERTGITRQQQAEKFVKG